MFTFACEYIECRLRCPILIYCYCFTESLAFSVTSVPLSRCSSAIFPWGFKHKAVSVFVKNGLSSFLIEKISVLLKCPFADPNVC